MKIIPVILCGGSGTRLWPLSRTSSPKQFLSMIDGYSLLQQTILRTQPIPGITTPIIVCNQDYRFITAEQLHEAGCHHATIILEPMAKNTAPAITLAALHSMKQFGEDTYLLVLPADHLLPDHDHFAAAVRHGIKVAQQYKLVTFGIIPTKAETGYGYIEKSKEISEFKTITATNKSLAAYHVQSFIEKPPLEIAEQFIQAGHYLWNSGIFLFNTSFFLKEMQQHAKNILRVCEQSITTMNTDLDFHRIQREPFNTCPSESIDYALMEKSHHIAVIPLDTKWSDDGSWDAMWQLHEADSNGNIIKGDVIMDQVSHSYLHAESRLLAAVGVTDLAVIETADAILVTHKNNSQQIKKIVEKLKQHNRNETECHRREYRPWGYYETLNRGPHFQVKHLMVKPGGKLSLQIHHHRSEHWIIIQGIATVTCGENKFNLYANQSTFIPVETKHRLENLTHEPIDLIEVQTGESFEEDDIIRFEDIYRREINTTE